MKKRHFIITGTSRGIGEALARQVLGPETVLFCVARNPNPSLRVLASSQGFALYDFPADLSDLPRTTEVMRKIFRQIDPEQVSELVLINNAGTIHPIGTIGSDEASVEIMQSITVNLTAAMLVTDHFARETRAWTCPRKVVNLSSGASVRAVHGWSAYCSGKAGLRMFAQCLAKEQQGRANPIKVMSFAPGIVDTEMQSEIRSADEEAFPELEKFQNFKEDGLLLEPELVAEKLLKLISARDFGAVLEVDVRNHL